MAVAQGFYACGGHSGDGPVAVVEDDKVISSSLVFEEGQFFHCGPKLTTIWENDESGHGSVLSGQQLFEKTSEQACRLLFGINQFFFYDIHDLNLSNDQLFRDRINI